MLGVDHDKIILLSTPFPTIPMLGKHCCCGVIVFYVGNKQCCIVLYCIVHRESHQAKRSSWKIFKKAQWFAEELGHWWTDRWHHTVFRNICLQNIQCAQNRLYHGTCCSPKRETRSNGPNKWWAPFSLEESPLPIDDMAKCQLPATWAPCALRNGMETCGFRTAARSDAHQCVHACNRRMIRRLAWIGIHEDWLRCLRAVHAGVPTPCR